LDPDALHERVAYLAAAAPDAFADAAAAPAVASLGRRLPKNLVAGVARRAAGSRTPPARRALPTRVASPSHRTHARAARSSATAGGSSKRGKRQTRLRRVRVYATMAQRHGGVCMPRLYGRD